MCSRVIGELSTYLPVMLCFHNLTMIPLHVSTFHWQLTTRTQQIHLILTYFTGKSTSR